MEVGTKYYEGANKQAFQRFYVNFKGEIRVIC